MPDMKVKEWATKSFFEIAADVPNWVIPPTANVEQMRGQRCRAAVLRGCSLRSRA
jgi:hypothetical protein